MDECILRRKARSRPSDREQRHERTPGIWCCCLRDWQLLVRGCGENGPILSASDIFPSPRAPKGFVCSEWCPEFGRLGVNHSHVTFVFICCGDDSTKTTKIFWLCMSGHVVVQGFQASIKSQPRLLVSSHACLRRQDPWGIRFSAETSVSDLNGWLWLKLLNDK